MAPTPNDPEWIAVNLAQQPPQLVRLLLRTPIVIVFIHFLRRWGRCWEVDGWWSWMWYPVWKEKKGKIILKIDRWVH
jgi:hypothetical protein